jgi:predicted  nucleic acid-binding Zn-ribbon protein
MTKSRVFDLPDDFGEFVKENQTKSLVDDLEKICSSFDKVAEDVATAMSNAQTQLNGLAHRYEQAERSQELHKNNGSPRKFRVYIDHLEEKNKENRNAIMCAYLEKSREMLQGMVQRIATERNALEEFMQMIEEYSVKTK